MFFLEAGLNISNANRSKDSAPFIVNTLQRFRILGGGFKCVLFSPLLGEDSHFD